MLGHLFLKSTLSVNLLRNTQRSLKKEDIRGLSWAFVGVFLGFAGGFDSLGFR